MRLVHEGSDDARVSVALAREMDMRGGENREDIRGEGQGKGIGGRGRG